MARHKVWEDIADTLRHKIVNGLLPPGSEFPSTKELMLEFDVHAGTIQNVVNALIREGLVISFGSGSKRRIVRPLLQRSTRYGGFLDEFAAHAAIEILKLDYIRNPNKLPFEAKELITVPVLIYRTLQFKQEIPVALSTSYIPGTLPIKQLKKLLNDPSIELYSAMEELGFKPTHCEESLIATMPDHGESELLRISLLNSTPVVRIKRKVYDADNNLLEMCYLSDRADSYEFIYKFPLKG